MADIIANISCQSMNDNYKHCNPGRCLFPFKFNKQDQNQCVPFQAGKKSKKGTICATKKGARGGLIEYGYCSDESGIVAGKGASQDVGVVVKKVETKDN